MSKKIIAVNASPHKDGDTAFMLKTALDILNKKGSVGVAVVIILIVLVIIVGAFISINNKTKVMSNNISGDTKNSGEKEQTKAINVEKQIDVIMNNIDTWNLSTDEDIYAPYGYAITDLDQNGRLEIIASSCQGTGIYTYSNYYEVNESRYILIENNTKTI